MSTDKKPGDPRNEGEDLTSAAVLGKEVPEFARGRHGPAQSPLPPVEVVPIPDFLQTTPSLHENRPRGSKPMIDVAGASARLRDLRPGAWLISPYTGWKWAKWPDGEVGWVPDDVELPAILKVLGSGDVH
jgi:hypothetical protein